MSGIVWCGCGDGIPEEELKCATCRMVDDRPATDELLDFIIDFHEHCDGEGLQHPAGCYEGPPDACEVVALLDKHNIPRCASCGQPNRLHKPDMWRPHPFTVAA